jgi:hypothetical protein
VTSQWRCSAFKKICSISFISLHKQLSWLVLKHFVFIKKAHITKVLIQSMHINSVFGIGSIGNFQEKGSIHFVLGRRIPPISVSVIKAIFECQEKKMSEQKEKEPLLPRLPSSGEHKNFYFLKKTKSQSSVRWNFIQECNSYCVSILTRIRHVCKTGQE